MKKKKIIFLVNIIAINFLIVVIFSFIFYKLYLYYNYNSSQSRTIVKTEFEDEEYSNKILEYVNIERQEAGLYPLQKDYLLTLAARLKMEDMIKYDYFSHTNPTNNKKWSEFIKESGYVYKKIGENLAIGYNDPKKAVEGWMESPTHRANILSDGFIHSGIAHQNVIYYNKETVILVHFFGG